jgi:hypothetical protein
MATQQMKIDLTAKDKTGNAFRSLNARLEKTRKVAKSVAGAVLKLGAAGAALGAGLAVATKKALEFADNIAKTADKVGLSTDALQKYRYAADLAGVSNNELDKAFDKLNKSIGESISDGTGAAFDAFTQLGLQADLASGKLRGTEPVFLAVADAISRVKDQSQRAALLADLFGRSGTKLAVLMRNGKGDIKAAADELENFGGVIKEGTLRNSENAIDAITRLTTLLKTKMTQALAESAPLIADFGKELLENLPKIIQGLKSVLTSLGLIGEEVKKKSLIELTEEQIKRQKILNGLLKRRRDGQDVSLTNAIKELEIVTEAIDRIERLKGAFDISPRPIKPPKIETEPGTGTGDNEPGLSPAEKKLKRMFESQQGIVKSAQEAAAAAKLELEYVSASEPVKNRALAVARIQNKLEKEKLFLNPFQQKQLEAQLDLTQQTQRTLALIKLDEQARIEAAEKLKETQRQANELIKTGLQSMQDGLAGLIDGTKTWKQALSGVLRTVINIAAKMGQTSTNGFSFGKLASGLGSLFGVGSVIGGQPIPVTGEFGGFPIMHTGGKIGRRNGQMPGLRSDERMIVGQTGERVLSRGQSAQGDSGAVVINQTINLSTGVQQTVRAEVMSLAPQIAAQAKAAVLDAKKRGGGFGAAFA